VVIFSNGPWYTLFLLGFVSQSDVEVEYRVSSLIHDGWMFNINISLGPLSTSNVRQNPRSHSRD
jgi:hypothetical protein